MSFARPCCRSTHLCQPLAFGDYELHYIVIPTTTLKPDIAMFLFLAERTVRCNISVIDKNGAGVKG